MKVWYKSDTPMKESTLLNKVMSIRRKEAQGEVDFYIDRILFIFVVIAATCAVLRYISGVSILD